MSSSTSPRLFLGIPVPATAIHALKASLPSPSERLEGWRWIPEENWHLTVCFIGTSPLPVGELTQKVRELLPEHPSFVLRYYKTLFMPEYSPRMIWARFSESSSFSRLSLACRHALLPPEKQEDHPPVPHITLARKRRKTQEPLPDPGTPSPFSIPVQTLTLWGSERKKSGAVHTPLENFTLPAGKGH